MKLVRSKMANLLLLIVEQLSSPLLQEGACQDMADFVLQIPLRPQNQCLCVCVLRGGALNNTKLKFGAHIPLLATNV